MTRLGYILRTALLLVLLAVLSGCVRMPTEGPVVESQVSPDADAAPGIYFDPRPPRPGQSASEIVSGFLEAMKATPIKTSVARQFLSTRARDDWTPERQILTYSEISSPSGELEMTLEMSDVNQYDERGAWRQTESRRELGFVLTEESGEWRIDEAPDALIVPDSWFADQYARVSLFFFDPASEVLVPEPVFVPRGDQFASSLVRGLLAPPAGESAHVAHTYFPPGMTLGLSVPISSAGVAEVSLTGDPDVIDEETAQRMLVQLVWTLRQEPRIRAVELSVGGQTFGIPGGPTQVNLDVGSAYNPNDVRATAELFALTDGRLVRGSLGSLVATAGPMGQEELGVSSVGVNLSGNQGAGVSGDGTSLLLAPVEQPDGEAVQVLSDAVDLQAPVWDYRDRAWLVDRAGGSARVLLLVDDKPREVKVPGITGRDVRRLLVSRDGSRLVAVLRGPAADRLVAARVQQDEEGRVRQVSRAERLSLAVEESARIRDIGWRSSTTVSVLSDITDDLSQVRTVSVDGSPGEISTGGASRLRGRIRVLVSSPLEGSEVYALGGRRVTDLTRPERPLTDLPRGTTSLTFAG